MVGISVWNMPSYSMKCVTNIIHITNWQMADENEHAINKLLSSFSSMFSQLSRGKMSRKQVKIITKYGSFKFYNCKKCIFDIQDLFNCLMK